jgi:hypothetical protein
MVRGSGRSMLFNATFSNISAISWLSVVLVEETEYREKTTDLSQVTDKHYRINLTMNGIRTSVIVTDCTGSCKSNYHTTTTTMTPVLKGITHNQNTR